MTKFEVPTQVQFKDDEDEVCYGIAWGDIVVCACCGSVIGIGESASITRVYENWVNFSYAIEE